MATIKKIIPNLWFDKQAEEAVKFYTTVFKDSGIGRISRYGKEGFEIHGMPEGTVMTIDFHIEGQNIIALNGGPHFKFNKAISFIVNCENQKEIDYYWDKLSESGDVKAQVCGWLKDKFGLSWQIIPSILPELINNPDSQKSQKVMKEFLQMKKIDMAALEQAAN